MGTPLLPIYSGEIQACALGMKVEIWNSDGQNIEDSGEAGDLVITKPFLSMPVGFWYVSRTFSL
jgi:acetoacetyl-CoA synthetase